MEYPHLLIGHYAQQELTGLLVATTHARTGFARPPSAARWPGSSTAAPSPCWCSPSARGDAAASTGRSPAWGSRTVPAAAGTTSVGRRIRLTTVRATLPISG